MAPGAITPRFRARARRYQMRRLRLGLASSGLEFGVTALVFVAAPRGGWPWGEGSLFLAGAAYFALLVLLRQAASLPLDYLAGFRLAHQVGLSNETLGGWVADRVKGFLFLLLIGSPTAGAFLLVMRARPQDWWWVAAALGAGLGALLTLIAPVLLAPLFFRFKPLDDPALRERLEGLLRRTGARMRGGVWEMDMSRRTKAANAALVGVGPSRRVIIADTLLSYAPEEIEAVLAHELAHHLGRHIPLLFLVRGGVLAGGLFVAQGIMDRPGLFAWLGLTPPAAGDPSAVALLWVLLAVWGTILSPFLLAVARRLEYACDRFAVRHTGGGEGMASALAKLCLKNLADPSPPRWVVALFHSHPPLEERIRRVREAGARAPA